MLSWQDEDFVAGVFNDEGRFVPGKAAKWCASDELMSRLDEVHVQHAIVISQGRDFETTAAEMLVVSACSEVDRGHNEEREKGRSIRYGYKHIVEVQSEEKQEGEGTLHGYTAYDIPILTSESRQSTKFLEDLEHLGIVMPLQRPRFKGYSTGLSRKAA